MKSFLKYAVLFLLCVVVVALLCLFTAFPDVDPPQNIIVQATPERLARGKYLAHHVSVCIDCHSTRDWKYFSGPLVAGTEGKGGELFSEDFGFPGSFYAKNITPAGIGSLSDGELFRVLTSGVRKNGDPLFPLMPYPKLNKLTDEDLYSIIAYVRSLPPINNNVPESHPSFPFNIIERTIPSKHEKMPEPNRANIFEYGAYVINAAGCTECHTQQEKGKPLPGMDFAGGFEFKMPYGVNHSANITPDNETGIGLWTKDVFIRKFKFFAADSMHFLSPDSMKYNTIMPWTMYAGMTEEDLGAIYEYLRTVPSVKNKVEKFVPLSNK